MDVRYVNPFISSIKNVFKTMLATEILVTRPRLKERDERAADVAAIIGFSGQARGSVALCFPMSTAVATASKFAGAALAQDHPEFPDALGELANMVAGDAKVKLEGFEIDISLPCVLIGQELHLRDPHRTPVLVLPCDSLLGRFSTEVTMVLDGESAGGAAS